MPGCSAIDCSNRTEQGYLLKAFPRDPQQRAIWTAKVKRLNWQPTNYSFLCEVSDIFLCYTSILYDFDIIIFTLFMLTLE